MKQEHQQHQNFEHSSNAASFILKVTRSQLHQRAD